jgi:hypothetical protein
MHQPPNERLWLGAMLYGSGSVSGQSEIGYWEIENGNWIFSPPFSYASFPTAISQHMRPKIGESGIPV